MWKYLYFGKDVETILKKNSLTKELLEKYFDYSVEMTKPKTLDEVREMFYDGPRDGKHNEIFGQFLVEMDKLILRELAKAETVTEIDEVFKKIPHHYDWGKSYKAVVNKLDNAIFERLAEVKTVKELIGIGYGNFLTNKTYQPYLDKLDELLLKEITESKTIEELSKLYVCIGVESKVRVPYEVRFEMLAREEIKMAKTAKHFKMICVDFADKRKRVYKSAMTKWQSVSLKEVKKAKTVKELRELLWYLPEDSDVKKLAIEKLEKMIIEAVLVATTFEEAMEYYSDSEFEHSHKATEAGKHCLSKCIELSVELWQVQNSFYMIRSDRYDELMKPALLKIIELS